ncbi:hypothetical protein [Aureispira anguillae]|uniref:Uncharacterized protein n=1 Tax=Aureispira anguillae TaxID=2864201 RepID=A0A916DU79_9BACT|nr:hypothetical protein [Aureispira anguillae]BDS13914.1 hypothetical protein AsAng_0046770 [Aureispira anguillae]
MSFYQKINQLINQCTEYQNHVDLHELWFVEPYQSTYLAINKVLKIYTDKKLDIEALAAGEQSAPGMPNLTPARAEYYQLKEKVPAFLASGTKYYYYLQTYKIACMHLIKTFSYSNFKGDWEKIRTLGDWMHAIRGQQEQHNAASSIQKSIKDIKELGDFEALDEQGLQQLEEEVRNIQALLAKEPNLQSELDIDDLQLFKEAAEYIKTNEELLQGLPELEEEFLFDEPPVLEVIAYRCRQLTVLVDDFPENYSYETEVVDLAAFKKELKDSFDLNINVCEDIYLSMLQSLGSYQNPRIKTFCQMLHQALIPFADEDFLLKKYGDAIFANYLEIDQGIPDTIDLEMHLMIAVGDIQDSI